MTTAIEKFLMQEEALEAERQLVNERWAKFELTGETLDHSEVETWVSKLEAASIPDAS